MKYTFKLFSLAAITVLMFSCEPYEEGPDVSLRSRSERMANLWEVTEATAEGENVIESFDQYELRLSKDGDAELDAEFSIFGQTYKTATDGTWEFTNEDNNVSMDFEDDDFDEAYQIILLKEDEMKLRSLGEDLEITLEPK